MTSGYIVTGTDTGVGKTIVAAGLAASLHANYWKPIQAGLEGPTDSETVAALGVGADRIIPEAYRLKSACSPHQAAFIDGVTIEHRCLKLPHSESLLIVEGAGGVMVPINDAELMLDLFEAWALPIILVARTTLGTINHSLLSIAALQSRDLNLAGIMFAGSGNETSEATITQFGKVRHLGRLPWLEPLDADTLASAMAAHIRLDLLR